MESTFADESGTRTDAKYHREVPKDRRRHAVILHLCSSTATLNSQHQLPRSLRLIIYLNAFDSWRVPIDHISAHMHLAITQVGRPVLALYSGLLFATIPTAEDPSSQG